MLIVDGVHPVSGRLASALTSRGLHVTRVTEQALHRFAERIRDYDCVLLDLGDRGDPAALTRTLRDCDAVSIVQITADRSATTRIEVIESGADDAISLPISHQELVLRIWATVRRARGIVPEA
ncbi:MAG TPA: response regulator [Kofleriaceae bacterium]|nr:response regulator [Kofleriaceae bacterium]